MSPVEYDITGKGGGPWVWRTLVLLAVIVASISLALSTNLFASNVDAINANTALSCRIGAFFVGTPVTKLPGESSGQYHHSVVKAESFLDALKESDCTNVKGARITRDQVIKELRALHNVVPKHAHGNRGGGSSSGAPSASTPGGAVSGSAPPPVQAPPPVTTPAPPPVTTTTPAPPPVTTTVPAPPPPPPPPPPTPCLLHLLNQCVPDPLGFILSVGRDA